MKTKLLPLCFIVLFISCVSEKQEEKSRNTEFKYHETSHAPKHPSDSIANPFNGATFKTQAFEKKSKDWGYYVYINGKQEIIQYNLPGAEKKNGFKSKKDALKVANLVVYKMKNNILPPSISAKELDSLGIR